jgi:hypothetical protein
VNRPGLAAHTRANASVPQVRVTCPSSG